MESSEKRMRASSPHFWPNHDSKAWASCFRCWSHGLEEEYSAFHFCSFQFCDCEWCERALMDYQRFKRETYSRKNDVIPTANSVSGGEPQGIATVSQPSLRAHADSSTWPWAECFRCWNHGIEVEFSHYHVCQFRACSCEWCGRAIEEFRRYKRGESSAPQPASEPAEQRVAENTAVRPCKSEPEGKAQEISKRVAENTAVRPCKSEPEGKAQEISKRVAENTAVRPCKSEPEGKAQEISRAITSLPISTDVSPTPACLEDLQDAQRHHETEAAAVATVSADDVAAFGDAAASCPAVAGAGKNVSSADAIIESHTHKEAEESVNVSAVAERGPDASSIAPNTDSGDAKETSTNSTSITSRTDVKTDVGRTPSACTDAIADATQHQEHEPKAVSVPAPADDATTFGDADASGAGTGNTISTESLSIDVSAVVERKLDASGTAPNTDPGAGDVAVDRPAAEPTTNNNGVRRKPKASVPGLIKLRFPVLVSPERAKGLERSPASSVSEHQDTAPLVPLERVLYLFYLMEKALRVQSVKRTVHDFTC